MDAATLKKLYETSHYALHVTTEGLTHEESLVQPQPAGNCANWILGHVVASRNIIFRLLQDELVWDAEQAAKYDRGATPLTDGAGAVPFARILEDLDRSQERLAVRLATLTEDELAAPSGRGDATVGWLLAFLQFHEAYHAGQLGLLRRLLGKDGAIR
jgi:uncharacterized damage-inducible protein DinB